MPMRPPAVRVRLHLHSRSPSRGRRRCEDVGMTVSYELTDGVAHVRIDDGKANVLNDVSVAGLEDALARAEHDHAGALVLWGRPRCFSGGIDLELVREADAATRTASL